LRILPALLAQLALLAMSVVDGSAAKDRAAIHPISPLRIATFLELILLVRIPR
jgi:hypothetical protein